MGVRWLHIPIVDERRTGDVKGIFDPIERAAAAIADPANQPVYFHCHHGVNRASMVQIAYRTLHCGWTLEQANDEISRTFGLREVSHGPDYRLMAEFYQERVLPRRAAMARAAEPSAVRLRSPRMAIAAIPEILGHSPHDCRTMERAVGILRPRIGIPSRGFPPHGEVW